MIASKFRIGQQVRHRLSGVLGVIVDVDPEYSLDDPQLDEVGATESLRAAPWYHVVMEMRKANRRIPISLRFSWPAKPRSNIRNSHPWMSWPPRSASSCRLPACGINGTATARRRLSLPHHAQPRNFYLRAAIHHHRQPGITRQHRRLLIDHAQLQP